MQIAAENFNVDVSNKDIGIADEQASFETWLKDFDERHAVLKTELDALLLSLGVMATASKKAGII